MYCTHLGLNPRDGLMYLYGTLKRYILPENFPTVGKITQKCENIY